MHAASELTLTSTYHACNQVAGILRGHLAAAQKLLSTAHPSGSTIHAARKELKHARAALRLLRASVDPEHFRQGDATLREAARQLNEIRDSDVLYRTFLRLRESVKDEIPRTNLQPLRRLLLEQRSAATRALPKHLTAVGTLLMQARQQTHDWDMSNDLDLLTRALQRTYRQARACFHAARELQADEQLHAWRRQVKYTAYQLETMGSLVPARMTRRLRRCAKLANLLGRDHDLALLSKRLPDADLDAAAVMRLAHAISRERRKLQRRALELAERLYRTKPRKYRPLH